jgi:Tol biopolymer transport system component
VWFPDGRRVAFGWLKDGRRSLAVQPADGTAPPRVIGAGELNPSFFPPDKRQVAASRGEDDMVLVAVENGQARVQTLIETPQKGSSADLSPDGRWLAYVSNVSRRGEVFVRPYPGPGAPEQVSVEGGRSPAWNPKGGELFFLSLFNSAVDSEGRMMAVDFADGSPPRIGRPRVLFKYGLRDVQFDCIPTRCYDVAPDGQRFYAMQSPTPPPRPVVTQINLIQNWFEELKAKVPTSGQKK